MSSFYVKIFTTSDEWKEMTAGQQQKRVYDLNDYVYHHQNKTMIMYEKAIRNLSEKDYVNKYNEILQNPEFIKSIEKMIQRGTMLI